MMYGVPTKPSKDKANCVILLIPVIRIERADLENQPIVSS